MFRKRYLALAVFAAILGFSHRYTNFRITQNFDVVVPGVFYRSAQLTPRELEQVVKEHGIKTVVSLRGGPGHTSWFKDQKATLEKLGVDFQVVWWMAEYFPPKKQLLYYLEVLKNAQYPVLVHCRVGSDRTGLASAIYEMEYLKTPKEEAIAKQLNFNYWHVEAFKPNMIEFLRRYQGAEWAKNEYNECAPGTREHLEHPECLELTSSAPN